MTLICAIIVVVYPYGQSGDFVAFVCDGPRCACGATRLLRHRFIMSAQPFIDAARMLLARGGDPNVAIVMTHGLSPDIALRSTVGEAAAVVMTSSRHGTPIFAKPKTHKRGSHCTAGSLLAAGAGASSLASPRTISRAGRIAT